MPRISFYVLLNLINPILRDQFARLIISMQQIIGVEAMVGKASNYEQNLRLSVLVFLIIIIVNIYDVVFA